MPTVQITFDARETESFEQQHDAFVRALRSRGLAVSRAIGHDPGSQRRETSEITVHLLDRDPDIALLDAVADIRSAAVSCLHDARPNLGRRLVVYGPQGQHLLELDIAPDERP